MRCKPTWSREVDRAAHDRRYGRSEKGTLVIILFVELSEGYGSNLSFKTKKGNVIADIHLRVKRELDNLPMPTSAKFIYREYMGCKPSRAGHASGLFATDIPTKEVCGSYLNHLQQVKHRWCFQGECKSGRYGSFCLRGHWITNSREKQYIPLTIGKREYDPGSFLLSTYGEQDAMPRARKMGKTIYSIRIKYQEDFRLYNRMMPENRTGACDYGGNRWFLHDEIDK